MPFTMPTYPILSPEQANPFFTGLQAGANVGQTFENILARQLENQKARTLMPFVEPNAQEELKKARLINVYQGLVNQFTPEDYRTTFAQRGAQTRLTDKQAQEIAFKLQNPGLYGDDTKNLVALQLMGLLNDKFQPTNQPLSQNIPQPGRPQSVGGMVPIADNNQGQMIAQALNQVSAQQNQPQNPYPGFDVQGYVSSILQKPQVNINQKQAQTAYQQKMLQGYNWSHLPVEARNQMIAQGYGMGVDPVKMANYVNEGLNVQQIAEKEGLDPDNLPPPIYPPTAATKTRVQQVEQVGAELDYLSSATTPIVKRYANTFAGYSPERIKDMLSNDPEAQKRFGEYIGALSIQTGLANGRVLLEGGRAGLEVMRMVKNSALQGIDQHSPIKMSGIAYEKAQQTIDEILQKGAKLRTTTGMNPLEKLGKSEKEGEKEEKKAKKENVIIYKRDSSGKLVRAK